MFDNYYVLKTSEYYLSEIEVIYTNKNELVKYTIDKEYKKLYSDFELAEEDRKLIFIETGLNLEIKKFREVE